MEDSILKGNQVKADLVSQYMNRLLQLSEKFNLGKLSKPTTPDAWLLDRSWIESARLILFAHTTPAIEQLYLSLHYSSEEELSQIWTIRLNLAHAIIGSLSRCERYRQWSNELCQRKDTINEARNEFDSAKKLFLNYPILQKRIIPPSWEGKLGQFRQDFSERIGHLRSLAGALITICRDIYNQLTELLGKAYNQEPTNSGALLEAFGIEGNRTKMQFSPEIEEAISLYDQLEQRLSSTEHLRSTYLTQHFYGEYFYNLAVEYDNLIRETRDVALIKNVVVLLYRSMAVNYDYLVGPQGTITNVALVRAPEANPQSAMSGIARVQASAGKLPPTAESPERPATAEGPDVITDPAAPESPTA